jgi:aromatic ring-opening dioxygenase catalytic subunit (LigB family)
MEWPRGPAGTWDSMAALLRGLIGTLAQRPRAVVVVSGHWEEAGFAVNTAARPPLLFDYYGFPPHTYQLSYPVAGDPALAERVRGLLEAAGFATQTDDARGLDHGVFIPFMLVLPDADVPIVELSLRADLDPRAHLLAGRALEPLRDEGVLVIGTGMSFHNLRALGPAGTEPSRLFDAWLTDAVTAAQPEQRNQRLADWQQAPAARFAHPREEHLLPLMIAAGAAGQDRGVKIYEDQVLDVTQSAFRFG